MRKIASLSLVIMLLPLAALAQALFTQDVASINEAVKSVLLLEIYDEDDKMVGTGSGFVAFNNRTLVTNHHVIEDADTILAFSDDGYSYLVDRVFAADENADIALLGFFSPTDLTPLPLGTESQVQRAEPIVAIGSPKGMINTVSMGNVSAVFSDKDIPYIQFTAPISSGSSGGALFNDRGEVIGVTSASYDDGEGIVQNLNFAVGISEAVRLSALVDEKKAVSLEEYNEGLLPGVTPTPEATAKPTPTPTVKPTLNPTPTVRPTVQFTPKPTVKPTPTPIPTLYKALGKGDRGDDVRKMQQVLIRLGYLDGTADGNFGKQTAQAVYDFTSANNLPKTYVATNTMLTKLYGGNAKAFRDPIFALKLASDKNGRSQNLNGDKLNMSIQVTNTAKKKTVKAFELYMYATDVWGNKLYGDTVYYATTTKKVAPGKTVYSDYITLPNRSDMSLVYVGISKIVYTDGTVANSPRINYSSWIIN